jgi:hypothetical protein
MVCGLLANSSTLRADEETDKVDNSIARALDFIKSEQLPNGGWRADAHGESSGITSLAIMAFMAAGHTPGEGPYGETINKGIRWVLDHQEPNGMLIAKRSHGPMYDHGIATLMLAECYGMVSKDDAPQVKKALEKAIRLILESQVVNKDRRHEGGWRYQVDSRDSDLSVTGWQVLALRAAKDIGCDVPAEAIDAAVDYVRNCATPDNKGFGYQPGSGATPTLTGTGITCLEVCGKHESREATGGAKALLENQLRHDSQYFYYGVYYTGVGMFKMGGDYADKMHARLCNLLIETQDPAGSWSPRHGGEREAGKVYATSMSVLGLAIEYRYLPIYQR